MEPQWAFFRGEFVPLDQAVVRIDTHAFNYGTGCFEGIRAYWNPTESQLYALKLLEHYRRMANSCRILNIDLGYTPETLSEITLELLRRNDFHQDAYVRPLAYKAAHSIKVRLTGHESQVAIYCKPMGEYLDTAKGLSVVVSSWRRLDDTTLPARSKATGAYLNAALASDEAVVLHCLPAHRGEEISASVLEGPRSVVWRQAAHRRTAMRGVLAWAVGAGGARGGGGLA